MLDQLDDSIRNLLAVIGAIALLYFGLKVFGKVA